MFWKNSVMLNSARFGDVLGHSGTSDVSTKMETNVPASKRRSVDTRRFIPLTGDVRRPSRSSVPMLERSRELLEQAFNSGMVVI